MQRHNVDLPDPEGPIMATTSPARTSKSTVSKALVRPNVLVIPCNEISALSLILNFLHDCTQPFPDYHVLHVVVIAQAWRRCPHVPFQVLPIYARRHNRLH